LSFLVGLLECTIVPTHRPTHRPTHPRLTNKQKAGGKGKGKAGGKKPTVKYTIDCFQPVDDKVLDMATFEKFLKDRIKVRSFVDVCGGVSVCGGGGG
jgi:hypothetical protein